MVIIVLGVPHLMPETSQRLLRPPRFAAYSDSNTLNFAIGFNGLTGTWITERFGEGSIDALNEGLGIPSLSHSAFKRGSRQFCMISSIFVYIIEPFDIICQNC